MIHGGIDVGNEGAIVACWPDNSIALCEPMPTINVGTTKKKKMMYDEVAILRFLRTIRAMDDDVFFVLEKAQAMPKQGVSSVFNYGTGYGVLRMGLLACSIPFDLCHPTHWQKPVLYGIEGSNTKARAILKVQRSLPDIPLIQPRCRTPHKGIADAACMMLHARTLRPPPR